ncbi:MAG: succinate dehydrogenase/fumarate reductase iron-sulfur subunit [Candidatus Micrarchaeaceae archaeon]
MVYMRASRYTIFVYAGIIGVPVVLLAMVVGFVLGSAYAFTVIPLLLALALMVFGISGIADIYAHPVYPGSMKRISNGAEEENKVRPRGRDGKPVDISIKRFNNETKQFDIATYKAYANDRTTVLGAMLDIKDYQDSTLSIRCNCRMGICGSCGMVVNGKPVLACETNLMKVSEGGAVEVSPMLGHPVLKDVVTDFGDFFNRHKSVTPTLYRDDLKEKYAARKEYAQTKEDLDKYLPYSYCIMCGLCLDACPVVNSNPNFIGPQALSQVYRYYSDSRDQKGKKRLFDIDSVEDAWGCEFSGSCSTACPKGVDPAGAIQLLKGDLMKNILEKE